MPAKAKPITAFNEQLNLTLYFLKAKDAAKYLGCDASVIAKVLKGKLKASWGWRFEFIPSGSEVQYVDENTPPLEYEQKKNPWNKGKTGVYTDEVRAKMGAVKGVKQSAETIKKGADARKEYYKHNQHHGKGKALSAEHRENISKGVRQSTIESATFTKNSFLDWCNKRSIEIMEIHDNDPDFLRQHAEVTKKCNNPNCRRTHKSAIYMLVRGEGVLCSRCTGKMSAGELSLKTFLEQQGFKPLMNAKPAFIAPKELDLYLPELNLAIEYHGLIHHSTRKGDTYVARNRHEEKYSICKQNGVKLIQVFEDEWRERSNIVLSMLKSKLGVLPIKTAARSCEVVQLSTSDAKEFFSLNHISGHASAKITFALKHQDIIVAALSLRRPFTEGKEGVVEIARFASAIDTSVVGGFSRLLKRAADWARAEGFGTILTYADCRWGSGGVYDGLGMEYLGKTKPNYGYENGKVREARFKHRKNNDPEYIAQHGATEKEQNNSQGWFEIYDAGSEIYQLRL